MTNTDLLFSIPTTFLTAWNQWEWMWQWDEQSDGTAMHGRQQQPSHISPV